MFTYKRSSFSTFAGLRGAGDDSSDEMSMIVVSNRLPFVLKPNSDGKLIRQPSAGGLVTAMAPVVKEHKGIWVGWSGICTDPSPDQEGEPLVIPEGDPTSSNPSEYLASSQIRAVQVETQLFSDYYNGCCNASLWPLLHSLPDRALFKRHYWAAYCSVNNLFAQDTFKAFESMREGRENNLQPPLIWIHDYQLMLVPGLIRHMMEEKDLDNAAKIAFFLHVPFPSWDVFRLFPWDEEILSGLLGCDLIGFHIESYGDNFLQCCQKRLGLRVDMEKKIVEHNGRTVKVRAFPIGVPFQEFEDMARQATSEETRYDDAKLVLGVDRLDYTKGILHRVKAFEHLLSSHPEHAEKVVLLQIAVPSRTDVQEYQELKDELDREVGRINGRFSTTKWSPIRYLYRCMKQEELCAFYRDASVALVTPIRDGMNLVAKEFVACQIAEPGVLILSPFTGAGETMHEALLVNPLEEQILAETINRALTMPLDERELRMSALRRRERINDIHHWVNSFLHATGAFNGDGNGTQFEPLTIQHFDKWLAKYVGGAKLALLLDYDGTLAPISNHPDDASLPLDTRQLLERLTKLKDLFVAVISGRSINNVKRMVGLEGITYAGNHGLDIEHPDGTNFVHPDQQKFHTLVHDLKQELDEEVVKEGAWIELKGVLLTYHYRDVHMDRRQALIDQATAIILKHSFRPGKAHCAVEARPPIKWDKGRASIHVLRTTFGVDWSERSRIIYVGDDATDEDAMSALKGMAVTFRVTSSGTLSTAANHRLHNTRSVYTLLQWVEQHFQRRMEKEQSPQDPAPSESPRKLSRSSSHSGIISPTASEAVFQERMPQIRINGDA